jgi:hypothetical protein
MDLSPENSHIHISLPQHYPYWEVRSLEIHKAQAELLLTSWSAEGTGLRVPVVDDFGGRRYGMKSRSGEDP